MTEPTTPTSPTVSILMAVHNSSRFLDKAVDSILSQSLRELEFVIVDDGSTDGSDRLLDEFARRDPRIVLIRQGNQGLTRSLNTALGVARGRYIARMDSDDIAEPTRLERQVQFMNATPDLVASGTGVIRIDASDNVIALPECVTDPARIDAILLSGSGGVVCHPSLIVRTDALRRIKGYDERFRTAQDLDLFLRLSEIGRLSNLDQRLLRYRKHEQSVNVAKFEQQECDVRAILDAAIARRGIGRPAQYMDSRWQLRLTRSLEASAQGRVGEALGHARSAWRMKPARLRSFAAVGLALLPPVASWRVRRVARRATQSVRDGRPGTT
jgi:glycosyltransferase involved in cell wall biosynthesis